MSTDTIQNVHRRQSQGSWAYKYSGAISISCLVLLSFYLVDASPRFLFLDATDQLKFTFAIVVPIIVAVLRPHYFRFHNLCFGLMFYLAYIPIVIVPSIGIQALKQNDAFATGVCGGSIIVALAILAFGRREFPEQRFAQINHRTLELTVVVLWIYCITGIALFFFVVPDIPIFELSRGTRIEALMELREESMKRLPLPLFLYFQLLRYLGFLMLSAVSLTHSVMTQSLWSRVSFIFSIIIGVIFSSLALAKGPPLLMLFFSASMVIYLRQKITLGAILLLCLGAFAPVYLAWILTPEHKIVELANDLFFRRILQLGADVTYFYFEAFPDGSPRLWGNGITLYNIIFGDGHFRLPTYIYQYMRYGTDVTGWANSGYIGGAWVDFGYAGMALESVVVGFLAVRFQNIFSLAQQKSLYDLPFIIFIAFFFACLSIQSLTGTFFLIAVPACLVLHRLLSGRRVTVSKRRSDVRQHVASASPVWPPQSPMPQQGRQVQPNYTRVRRDQA